MNSDTQPTTGSEAGDLATTKISAQTPESDARLRALLAERGTGLRIRIESPADMDVTGHQLGVAAVTLRVLDDDDDTEGHAMSLHFPSPHDAKQFERRLLATGAIVGTLVIAGGGGLALSQALPDTDMGTTTAGPATTISQGLSPARPLPADGMTGKQEGLLAEVTGVDSVQTGAAPINPATGNAFSGKEQALLDEITGTDAE